LLVEGKVAWRLLIKRAAAALSSSLLGLGIAAALILPNLLEREFINQEQWVQAGYDYAQHFVQPAHFLSAAWGYAPGPPGTQSGMSFQLGIVPFLLATVTVVGAFRRPARERARIVFFAAALILLLFFMLPVSVPLWEWLPLAALIQFPWRLMSLMAVVLAVLSGLAIPNDQHSVSHILVLLVVIVLASFPYTLPQHTPIPESAEGPLLSIEFELEYTDMRGMTYWTEEMPPDSPLVAQYLAGQPLVTAEALAPGASVEMIRAGGASDELWVRSAEGTVLRFYTYYFPGWRVYVDGERLPDSALRPEGPYGLLTVDVPPGEHRVLLRWGDTPVRLTGKVLTLLCLGLALALILPTGRIRGITRSLDATSRLRSRP
jgi:hypothetical protein